VAGAGTGGTITGLARAIRDHESSSSSESSRRTTVLAVDPEGSILGGGEPGVYEVEGIGYDFFPEVLDPNPPVIDEWIKTNDSEAFAMTKHLIRTEGIFVGGSSGSALSACLRYLHSPSGQSIADDPSANVVVILPDGVRNYMSKPWFLDVAQDEGGAVLRSTIKHVIGRELNEPGPIVREAEVEGKVLQDGEGVEELNHGTADAGQGPLSITGVMGVGKLPETFRNPAALAI